MHSVLEGKCGGDRKKKGETVPSSQHFNYENENRAETEMAVG